MRRPLCLLAALAFLLPGGSALSAPEVTAIQPGASIRTPIGGCTMNFVYRDADGRTYVGTAGHCANVGHRITASGVEFGTVVYSENAYPITDFALILVDPEDVHLVNPAMRYWGGPTGLATFNDLERGDTVLAYGYGMGYSTTEYSRRRIGVLNHAHPHTFTAVLNCIFGDSGGPVVHGPSGKALGVIDVLKLPGTGGTLIYHALRRMAVLTGIEVELVTAPLEPIPQV